MAKKRVSSQTATRLKRPINPSIRGTGKQAQREDKGVKGRPAEGRGQRRGGARKISV